MPFVELTPDLATAIGEMRQLQMLRIKIRQAAPGATSEALADALRKLRCLRVLDIDARDAYRGREVPLSRDCLDAIATATQLEYLCISGVSLRAESLGVLARLTHLKSLGLYNIRHTFERQSEYPPLLSNLPTFPELEAFALVTCHVGDLQNLTRLPRLKKLALVNVNIGPPDAALAKVASLPSLEELSIDQRMISPAGYELLHAAKRLKRLELQGLGNGHGSSLMPIDDWHRDRCLGALNSLLQAKPELVVETLDTMQLRSEDRLVLPEYEASEYSQILRWREVVPQWKLQRAQAGQGP